VAIIAFCAKLHGDELGFPALSKPEAAAAQPLPRSEANRSRPPIVVLVLVTAIAPASLHILVPSLPLLALVFDVPAARVQLVLTLFLAGIAIGQLVYGPISDRLGRRPVLIAGLVVFLAGTVLCGFAWSLPVLIVGRVLQACGGCAGMVLGRAIVRDVFDRERSASAIAVITMAMSLAPSLSPAVGAYLAEWIGWRADFALLGAVGAAILVVTTAKLEETHTGRASLGPAAMATSFVILLRSPAFRGFAIATAFTSASWFTFLASAPYLLFELLHEPPSTYGLMILLPMVGYVIGNAGVARLSIPFGITRLYVFGLALSLASGLMLAVWCLVDLTPWALFVPMAISSVGNGLSQPPGIAAGLSVHPRIAGAASGLMGFLQMMIAAIGTFLIGQLPQATPVSMVAVVGASLALALAFGLPALRAPEGADHPLPADRRRAGVVRRG
jgi:MFS transporter, DHA1 family, multidrug resistance protein